MLTTVHYSFHIWLHLLEGKVPRLTAQSPIRKSWSIHCKCLDTPMLRQCFKCFISAVAPPWPRWGS